MADISFYHLSSSTLEKALAKLLEKTISVGKKAVVLADTSELLASIDTALWTYSPNSFLPHGTNDTNLAEHQPIYLTTTFENPNSATILMVVEGTQIENFKEFDRCLDIFNGMDPQSVEDARRRWTTYKEQGHNLTYWFQNESGSWVQKQ